MSDALLFTATKTFVYIAKNVLPCKCVITWLLPSADNSGAENHWSTERPDRNVSVFFSAHRLWGLPGGGHSNAVVFFGRSVLWSRLFSVFQLDRMVIHSSCGMSRLESSMALSMRLTWHCRVPDERGGMLTEGSVPSIRPPPVSVL